MRRCLTSTVRNTRSAAKNSLFQAIPSNSIIPWIALDTHEAAPVPYCCQRCCPRSRERIKHRVARPRARLHDALDHLDRDMAGVLGLLGCRASAAHHGVEIPYTSGVLTSRVVAGIEAEWRNADGIEIEPVAFRIDDPPLPPL